MKISKQEFIGMLYYYKSALPYRSPDFENNKQAISFWWDKFSGFTARELQQAFDEAVASQDHWPTPRELLTYLGETEVSNDDKARQVSAMILTGIRKFGYRRPNEAKQYLGPIGWKVVEMQGGWERICETEEKNVPTLQAQWRDLAKSIYSQTDLVKRLTDRIVGHAQNQGDESQKSKETLSRKIDEIEKLDD